MIGHAEQLFTLNELKLEVTHRCSLACIHCSSDATPSSPREMPPDKCLSIINDAIEMGAQDIAFSGGEPLLWTSIGKAIEAAASGNLRVSIYTSGNIEGADIQLRDLRKRGLKRAAFSLYGSDAGLHEYITRISGSFAKTIAAIVSSVKCGLETELHFVALAENYRALRGVVQLGRKLNVFRVSVLRFVPQGRGYLLQRSVLSRLQNLELKQTIESLRTEGYDIRTGSPFNFLLLNEQPACLSGISRLIIGPDLQVFPCDAFKQITAEELVGTSALSSVDKATLKECWQGSPYLNAVRKYLSMDFTEPCKSCNVVGKCLSGCLAQKVIAYGGLVRKPDPMCLLSSG